MLYFCKTLKGLKPSTIPTVCNIDMQDLQSKISQYVCCANEAVKFKLIKDEDDLTSDKGFFHPDMSHQIFGEREQLFGYKGLKVVLAYLAGSLDVCVKVSYTDKIDPELAEGVEPDDILPRLKDVLPKTFFTNIDQFSSLLLKKADFHPHGVLISSYSKESGGGQKTYEIYKPDVTCPGYQEYHEKMESFILWFIDAASFIDVDDDKWDFFTVFEKVNVGGASFYLFVGYATCYRFYAYPDKCRPRVSQVLILPPYQKQGHCTNLLSAIYRHYVSDVNVVDITAEDPSDNFQRVRDFLDSKNCAGLPEFSDVSLKKPFSKDMAQAAQKRFKINKRQARRVYEILRLKNTNKNDEKEFKEYRLCVKQRLYAPMKNDSIHRKAKFLPPGLCPSAEEQQSILQKEFEKCLTEYEKVVQRLEYL